LIQTNPYTKGRVPRFIYASPDMWIKRQFAGGAAQFNTAASTIQAFLSPLGCRLVQANNDRINGWREFKRRLAWAMTKDGQWLMRPQFFYFLGECDAFERTLPNLVFGKKVGDQNAEDMEKHQEDHAAEEARYLCMGLMTPEKQKKPERKITRVERPGKPEPKGSITDILGAI